jgi:glycosyltransferase involved in cell wall biosynthesis
VSGQRIILCSKSTWRPAIRREHALARLAAAHGHRVSFVERPLDVRALREGRTRTWLAAAAGRGARGEDGVHVVPTAVVVPGHRDALAERLERATLSRRLRALGSADATVVATVPWRWSACTAAPATRRVFDCADDWSDLLPGRRDALLRTYERIGAEADAVVVVNPELADLFGGRAVRVVGNGVSDELLDARPTAPIAERLAYAGTFTERFDAQLVDAALGRLPRWRIDLYGQCQYPGAGDRPAGDLAALLERHPDRVRWHGVLDRAALPAALDAATVLVVPHRPNTAFGGRRGWGGDVMKLYDYAARGRAIVSTDWSPRLTELAPPGTRVVPADPAAFAEAIRAAAADPAAGAEERRAWARARSWSTRWEDWSQEVVGG